MVDTTHSEVDAAQGEAVGPADASHTALEDLLAVIAHELRAPLTVVHTAAETIATGHLSPEQLGPLLQVIRRNAELAMLLTDRLGLARAVEVGEVDLDAVELDLVALVEETVADLGPSVAKQHDLQVRGAGPIRVVAGETSLREILLNLLLNAVKYSPEGSTIEVTVAVDDGVVTLAVRDHGCGVAPDDTARIFDKYTQVDGMAPGVGLGLYISRGLARANGGDLVLDTATGDGSRFILQLDAAPVAATSVTA